MNRRLTIASAIVFGLASFAAASSIHLKPSPANSAIPVPLCNPDMPTCDAGGPGLR